MTCLRLPDLSRLWHINAAERGPSPIKNFAVRPEAVDHQRRKEWENAPPEFQRPLRAQFKQTV